MKKCVLFVDDELNILKGLERSLRGQRDAWEMVFVDSGQAALKQLNERHFDAIVTDMRMPGMDGAQLLEAVVKDHSELIRIILSGHSDEEMIIKSTGTAHQFLAKPCDIENLKETLIRAFELKALLTDKRLQSLVTGLARLPSMPQTYQNVMAKLRSPHVSLREIGEVITTDPAMTAKILQLVNSAFFGLGRHVSNSEEAATLIGLETLKALILSFGIFSQFDHNLIKDSDFSIESLWQHSLAVAKLAKRIAQVERANKTTTDDCFLAGMLHDIGILILVQNFPEDHARVRAQVAEQGVDLLQTEQEIFGTTHAAVAAFLFGIWGLSDSVVEAVAFHHQPTDSKSTRFSPLAAVHTADILTNQAKQSKGLHFEESRMVDPEFLLNAGLTERFEVWAHLELEGNEA